MQVAVAVLLKVVVLVHLVWAAAEAVVTVLLHLRAEVLG
jgi:hypothetical protein